MFGQPQKISMMPTISAPAIPAPTPMPTPAPSPAPAQQLAMGVTGVHVQHAGLELGVVRDDATHHHCGRPRSIDQLGHEKPAGEGLGDRDLIPALDERGDDPGGGRHLDRLPRQACQR